jgi:outer membrane lipoprotein-sorting protein
MGIKQLFNGAKVITVVEENEEVTIVDKSDEQDSISPSNLFDFYRDGYTYQMDIEQKTPEGLVQFVKLIPIDSDSEMDHYLLGILVEQLQIYKLIQKGNNGTVTTISVKNFTTNTSIDTNAFVFDRAKYEELGYYIIED